MLSDASLHTTFGVLFCNYHMCCAVLGFNSTVTLLFYASALEKFLLIKETHFARYVTKCRPDVRTSCRAHY
jgi:hypothetical protein